MKIILYILITFAGLYLYAWYIETVFQKQFKKYLSENEGNNILFYNNRKNSKDFIETVLMPRLSNRIDRIYLDGKVIARYEDDRKFIKRILFNLKNYSKFPHLVKIRNGRVEDVSINNQVFNCINQGKSISLVIDRINQFFEIR